MAQVMKKSPANVEDAEDAEDAVLIPESEWSPGEANGNPLQYLCLENSTYREVWWATVYGDTKSQTQLSISTCIWWMYTKF